MIWLGTKFLAMLMTNQEAVCELLTPIQGISSSLCVDLGLQMALYKELSFNSCAGGEKTVLER